MQVFKKRRRCIRVRDLKNGSINKRYKYSQLYSSAMFPLEAYLLEGPIIYKCFVLILGLTCMIEIFVGGLYVMSHRIR